MDQIHPLICVCAEDLYTHTQVFRVPQNAIKNNHAMHLLP